MYDVIIVDEGTLANAVHERHITGDFLLGILKRIIQYRDDIRIGIVGLTKYSCQPQSMQTCLDHTLMRL
jgi:hypothetical protein